MLGFGQGKVADFWGKWSRVIGDIWQGNKKMKLFMWHETCQVIARLIPFFSNC